MEGYTMQSTKPRNTPANDEGNQHAFWAEMERLAMRGMDRPGTLTHAEISKMCRLALVAMNRNRGERSIVHPSSLQT